MIKILFVCHGNICRSPMAEFVMKDYVKKAGLEKEFEIASAATSREELGNPVYPPARRELAKHGLSCSGKYARQMTAADYERYDYIPIIPLPNPPIYATLSLSNREQIRTRFWRADFRLLFVKILANPIV